MDWPISWNDVKNALDNASATDVYLRSNAQYPSEVSDYTIVKADCKRVVEKLKAGVNPNVIIELTYVYGGVQYNEYYSPTCYWTVEPNMLRISVGDYVLRFDVSNNTMTSITDTYY